MHSWKIILLFWSAFLCSIGVIGQQPSHLRCKYHHSPLEKTGTADNLRSDTIDVLNYKIQLDFSNVSGQQISGACQVKFTTLQNNVSSLSLDLLEMTIDSIRQQNNVLNYSYNDTLLIIELSSVLNQGQLDSVSVFYHGHPAQDPSGWGGFYFQGNYAYNLGVGFEEDPHNYGRVWHPCFDNFVERATYDFEIKTPPGLTSYANGLIQSDNDFGTHRIREWKLQQPIPSYLACVAISDYTHVDQDYISIVTGNTTPMYLIAAPTDTNNFKTSFQNLGNTMDAFERQYGPYQWDKVGFHLVPFNSGAMEHATSIAYPKSAANGGLGSETLMAHELSHHWWGNLVTCRTDGDMWINEGLASYSERIFLEEIYGYDEYIKDIRNNHRDILANAHLRDGGYYAISGVPHNITYGDHSYNKGTDVAHNLRTYMGDTAFFNGLQSFLTSHAFQDVDAYDFRDHLSANTSVNVDQFFADWVFNPGYPGFALDSTIVTQSGTDFLVTAYVHQKLKGTSQYFLDVPMDITFHDANWADTSFHFTCIGEYTSSQFTLPFNPVLTYLNGNNLLSEAVTGEQLTITNPVTKDLSFPLFRYTVSNSPDSSLVRIEHYWVAPDSFKEPQSEFSYHLSQERYWKVDGIWANGFEANARVFFNGKSGVGGELDIQLTNQVGFHEDSLKLFYRSNPSSDWEEDPNVVLSSLGSTTDGYGYFTINNLRKGEYTFGWRKSPLSVPSFDAMDGIKVYPNPSSDWLTVDYAIPFNGQTEIQIYSSLGELVIQKRYWSNQLYVGDLSPGIYFLKVTEQGLSSKQIPFIVE